MGFSRVFPGCFPGCFPGPMRARVGKPTNHREITGECTGPPTSPPPANPAIPPLFPRYSPAIPPGIPQESPRDPPGILRQKLALLAKTDSASVSILEFLLNGLGDFLVVVLEIFRAYQNVIHLRKKLEAPLVILRWHFMSRKKRAPAGGSFCRLPCKVLHFLFCHSSPPGVVCRRYRIPPLCQEIQGNTTWRP